MQEEEERAAAAALAHQAGAKGGDGAADDPHHADEWDTWYTAGEPHHDADPPHHGAAAAAALPPQQQQVRRPAGGGAARCVRVPLGGGCGQNPNLGLMAAGGAPCMRVHAQLVLDADAFNSQLHELAATLHRTTSQMMQQPPAGAAGVNGTGRRARGGAAQALNQGLGPEGAALYSEGSGALLGGGGGARREAQAPRVRQLPPLIHPWNAAWDCVLCAAVEAVAPVGKVRAWWCWRGLVWEAGVREAVQDRGRRPGCRDALLITPTHKP